MKSRLVVWLGLFVVVCNASFGQDRDELLGIEWVVVADPGNSPDDSAQGRGAVGYEFKISKYEITAAQWVIYLNDVDPFGLGNFGGGQPHILKDRTRPDGEIYYVPEGFENHPATQGMYIRHIIKFCNWLHGVEPTDEIAYTASRVRLSTAKFWIPNADEWHKAAYYQGGGVWAPYSTGSEINNQDPPGDAHSANFGRTERLDVLPVGSYPMAVGHYGTFDMSGNVAEQLETDLLAGGHFLQVEFYQRASTRLAGTDGTHGSTTGSRVAAASGIRPEPETPQLFIEPAINLRWQSVNGQGYKVQSSTDLATWVDEETVVGDGGTISLFREKDATKRFWRVMTL